MIEHRGEAVFLPGDPPRRGALALYAPPPTRGPGRRAELSIVVRAGTVARRTTVDARVVPIAEASPGSPACPQAVICRRRSRPGRSR